MRVTRDRIGSSVYTGSMTPGSTSGAMKKPPSEPTDSFMPLGEPAIMSSAPARSICMALCVDARQARIAHAVLRPAA
jgi:hypothetical protein